MSEPEGELWDAPNQQVVRADSSAPWDEGTGGTPDEPAAGAAAASAADLDALTKAELLQEAQRLGVVPANQAMSKDELRAGIDARLKEG